MAKIIEPTCVVDWEAIDEWIDDGYILHNADDDDFYGLSQDERHNLTKYNRVESPYCESEFRNGKDCLKRNRQEFVIALSGLYSVLLEN